MILTLLTPVWVALLMLASVQQPPKVRLADAIADPTRYNHVVVEVAEEFQAPAESPWYICALGCAQSKSMDDLVLFHVPDSFAGEVDLSRLKASGRTAKHVRVRAVGKFDACDTACWGFPPRFRFRLVVSKILNVETSDKPFKRPKR